MSLRGTQGPQDAPQQMTRGSDEIRVPGPATSPHTGGSSEASAFSRGHAPAQGPGAGELLSARSWGMYPPCFSQASLPFRISCLGTC